MTLQDKTFQDKEVDFDNFNVQIVKKLFDSPCSCIYKVIDSNNNIYALKEIICSHLRKSKNTHTDYTTNINDKIVSEARNEIFYLKQLSNHPEIINIYDSTFKQDKYYLLIEYGITDLMPLASVDFYNNMEFMKTCWDNIVKSVQVIHSYNIVHSDLKPENFIIVGDYVTNKDPSKKLSTTQYDDIDIRQLPDLQCKIKLIDFGFASTLPENTEVMYISSVKGTLDFIAPERLKYIEDKRKTRGVPISKASDIWSLGSILYEIIYNKVAFPGDDQVIKIDNILDPNFMIDFPEGKSINAKPVIEKCLAFDPKDRPTIEELSEMNFFSS